MSSPSRFFVPSNSYVNQSFFRKQPLRALYTGPGLPYTAGKEIPVKSDESLVLDSITQILNTARGERLMEPEFGCLLEKLLFEQDTLILQRRAEIFISDAIKNFEPRVQLTGVYVQSSGSSLTLNYTVRFIQTSNIFKGVVRVDNR